MTGATKNLEEEARQKKLDRRSKFRGFFMVIFGCFIEELVRSMCGLDILLLSAV